MCDTIVALGNATKDGITLFAKNSDREPDEVQNIEIYPRQKYSNSEMVKCTYITIPQVLETVSVFLCRPFWMFGAEMGANEYGVVIGNEALLTKEKPSSSGLTGMDLLRLSLERSRTAKEALDTIIVLLEQYGQGGNCGYREKFSYMNGFIIADSSEAYVLETIKSWWAWKKVTDIWSMSNIISLQKDFDACSPGLIKNAIKKGYCKSKSDFNFRRCYTNKIITWGARSKKREDCTRSMLIQKKGSLTTADFMTILRGHGKTQDKRWQPDKSSNGIVCMHAADKFIRKNQSVCSFVAKIGQTQKFFYTTGAANPCMSPFFPVFAPDTAIPLEYRKGDKNYDGQSFWWEAERFHRIALTKFPYALEVIQPEMQQYEQEMVSKIESLQIPLDQKMIDEYFAQVGKITREWGRGLDNLKSIKLNWFYKYYWKRYNTLNGIK